MAINLNGRAILSGIGLYVLLYFLHIGALPWLVGEKAAGSDEQVVLYFVSQGLGILTCLAPGYLAAKMAGHHGFVHGGLVGGISTVITALIAMVFAIVAGSQFVGFGSMPFWVVVNGFLGAFAGIMASDLTDDETEDTSAKE